MERAFKIGCHVVFFDSHRQPHDAIVTNWFHGGSDGETYDEYVARQKAGGITSPIWTPCCNLVYVSESVGRQDSYGRQIERQTSCGNGRQGTVPFLGMCWARPDEAEEAKVLAAKAFTEAVAK
jgi:hypothetical protein